MLLIFTTAYSSECVEINADPNTHSVNIQSSDIVSTTIEYQVNRYIISEVTIDGQTFTQFQAFPRESMIMERGAPELPRINRSLVIPDDGAMGYEVLSSEYIEIGDIDIAPSKGALLRSIDPESVPYEFSDIYNIDEFYPSELITMRKPYIIRDYRGMVVEFNAFQYNPVKRILRIYTKVEIEVKKTAPGGENTILRSTPIRKIDPQFDKIYRRHFVNWSGFDYPSLLESGSMLIICHDDFIDEMEEFIAWKNQRGIFTEIVPASEAGATPSAIKDYIDDYYRNNNLGYVLLVGDAAQIPTFTADTDGDGKYSLLTGNDNYPEIFVGRFSAETSEQVLTQVERTIDYEKYPDPALSWYHEGFVIGSTEGPFPSHYNEHDYTHMTNIAYKLLDHTYTQIDSAYDNWCTMQMAIDFINEGNSILYYAGHGGPEGWGTTGISTAEVNEFTNSNMLPHIVSVACNTGQFEEYTCLGEAWLRATHNITGEPTGAIGFYGSVEGMTGPAPLHMQDECIDLLVADSMWTLGGLCYNGAMYMMDMEPGTGEWEFNNLCIFGDPSVSLRGGIPLDLSVYHSPELLAGMQSFNLTVTSQGSPVKGLMVCCMNNEEYVTTVTNNSGQAVITFAEPLSGLEPLHLTISGGDAIPYIVQIPVVFPANACLVYEDHTIQDDLTGNGNGQLEFFETVELSVTLGNNGAMPYPGGYITLDCENQLVTITRDSAWMEELDPGESVTLNRAFEFSLAPGLTNYDPIIFDISESGGNLQFSVVCHAPEIEFMDLLVDDRVGGNGDSLLSPGESAEFLVTVVNSGSYIGEDITANLSCGHPDISILINTYNPGDIEIGTTARLQFTVSASNSFYPPGLYIEFDLDISGDHGYETQDDFATTIGDPGFAPTGPDEYGYSAYDSGDYPFFTEYDWIELVPDSGGTGHMIPFTQIDEVYHLAIPFDFQYYGIVYDSLTITTPGHICMGVTNELDYTATSIPNLDGPPAMICPVWGDLDPAGATVGGDAGGVWYEYDPAGHYLVIEYNYVPWYAAAYGDHTTYEIILYDPEYYPTITGDGQIKFQFKVFEAWGPTGIENETEDIGLEYRYGDNYSATALPLADESAVLFSTPPLLPDLLITIIPLSPPIIVPATGGTFEFNISLENQSEDPQLTDVWAEIFTPLGSTVGPTINAPGITISAGQTIDRDRTQIVPANAPGGTYIYKGYIGEYPWVVAQTDSFTFEKSGSADGEINGAAEWQCFGEEFTGTIVKADTPTEYSLMQNYPNPFNPVTTIAYTLPEAAKVKLTVFNTIGQQVAVLVDGFQESGYKSVEFDAGMLSSGIYFYRIEAGSFTYMKKMVLIK